MQVWINTDDPANVAALATALEGAIKANAAKELKAFMIFVNPSKQSPTEMTKALSAIGKQQKLEKIALAYLPGPDDPGVRRYAMNTSKSVKNTLLFYKGKQVKANLVNLVADKKGLATLDTTIKLLLE